MARNIEPTVIITTGGALWFGDEDAARPQGLAEAHGVARSTIVLSSNGGSLDAMVGSDGWIWVDFSDADGRLGMTHATDSNEHVAIWHDRLQVLHTILYFLLAGTTDENLGRPTPWAFTRTPLATVTGTRVGCPSMELSIGIGSLDDTGQIPVRASPGVAQRALDSASGVLRERADASALVELLLKALVAYQAHDHGHCAVVSWAICEAVLNARFSESLTEMVAYGTLTESQSLHFKRQRMSSSEVANLLLVNGTLGGTLFDQMTAARQARNAWVHRLRMPEGDITTTCMIAARSSLAWMFPSIHFGNVLVLPTL